MQVERKNCEDKKKWWQKVGERQQKLKSGPGDTQEQSAIRSKERI